ncbi:MAG: hypothetical protein KAH23_01175 [Kiritimatiellae bacterium]|nr:hypothetical protein [Kiritimatiellia bacterium]
MIIENEQLKVTLNKSFSIEDKQNETRWKMCEWVEQLDMSKLSIDKKFDVGEHRLCRFEWKEEADAVRFTFKDKQGAEMGQCLCSISLDRNVLSFEILEYQGEFSALGFPPPMEQDDALLLPMQMGSILKSPRERYMHCFHNVGLSMRWFGGTQGDNTYLAILETPANAAVWSSGEELSATPIWEPSMEKWHYPRKISYRFMQGSFVQASRAFREYASEQGFMRTLKDKCADNQLMDKMGGLRMIKVRLLDHQCKQYMELLPEWAVPGGHKLWNTFEDVSKMCGDLQSLGVKNAAIILTGWTNRGYDNLNPDILPPSEELGGSAGLKKLINEAPYLIGLHDNYTDIYEDAPSFPHGARLDKDGNLSKGGVWDGGQAYNVCCKEGLKYCQRNMQDIKEFNPKAMFIDVLGAGAPMECFHPDHMADNREDIEYRMKFAEYLHSLGLMVGFEVGQDWALSHAHYFEGIMGESYIPFQEDKFKESVPLFNLAFHDCVLSYRYQMRTYAQDYIYYRKQNEDCYQDWRENMLWDILYGNPTNWTFKDEYPDMRERMKDTLIVEELHKQIVFEELTDHVLLSDNGKLRKSTFSNGTEIIVNFNKEPVTIQGQTIPGMGYVL